LLKRKCPKVRISKKKKEFYMKVFAKVIASQEQSTNHNVYSTQVHVKVQFLMDPGQRHYNTRSGISLISGPELEEKINKNEPILVQLFGDKKERSFLPTNLFFMRVQDTAKMLADIFKERGIEAKKAECLEIGCEYGRGYEALNAIGVKGQHYTGIDINTDSLLVARGRAPRIAFNKKDATVYTHRKPIDVAFWQSPFLAIEMIRKDNAVKIQVKDPHTGDEQPYPYSKTSIKANTDILKNIGSQLSDNGCMIIFFRMLPDYIGMKECVLKELGSEFTIVLDVTRIDPYTAVNPFPVGDTPLMNALLNNIADFSYLVVEKKNKGEG
jgi:SAM-dependent methyltransferase